MAIFCPVYFLDVAD